MKENKTNRWNKGELPRQFEVVDPSHPDYNQTELEFETYTKTIVKSSTGIPERRYKIKTEIQLGKKVYETTFTLTDRGSMKYPVLLGRVILNKRFIVDVSKKNVLNPKNKSKKIRQNENSNPIKKPQLILYQKIGRDRSTSQTRDGCN